MPEKGETQKEPWAWDVSESETAKRGLTDSGHHRKYGLLKKKKVCMCVHVCARVCVRVRVCARTCCVCVFRVQEGSRIQQA